MFVRSCNDVEYHEDDRNRAAVTGILFTHERNLRHDQRALELWGGHECTVNRVADAFQDQTLLSGHDARLLDLERFAALGVAALRYPLLWERIAPHDPDAPDWQWSDARLAELRRLGIRPIAGLVHHGGGPRYAGLLDAEFAPGLARFAGQVAARYDWIDDWTPVNEPVTTARFSALYGHWHPHRRDERSFWTALLNQVDGTRLAMRAIRRVNPRARLIQTDDLGRSWATVPLRHQAAFDNVRRWMGWDLLFGRVVPEHPLWDRLDAMGFGERLRAIADDPSPPDVIGINHYLTSDRFLDHRLRHYPPCAAGGNAQQRYADVAAIRVLDPPPAGLRGALREAWARYGTPLAVTEVHNGCTRDEQMRWMAEAWDGARALRGEGVAIEAVTSWALLGSQGWDTLLTAGGSYEPGAFDVRAGAPRATALAAMLPRLGTEAPRHPALAGQGWWRRPIRLLHPPVRRPAPMRERQPTAWPRDAPPLLIAGATGTLGQALARACRHRDLAYVLTARGELDLDDAASIERTLRRHRPWAVINAAGWVRVDAAEHEAEACLRANAAGAALLAALAAAEGMPTVSFSSDLVFDGAGGAPYREEDAPHPAGVYGTSKLFAERALAAMPGDHLVIRTAAFFSPHDPHNFAAQLVAALGAGRRFDACASRVVTPTYVPHLCDAVLDLLIDGETGLWHLTSGTALSWAAFAERVAARCGLDARLIRADATRAPADTGLASGRGTLLPPLDHALADFAAHTARRHADRARRNFLRAQDLAPSPTTGEIS